MKFVSYVSPDGAESYGVVDGSNVVDLGLGNSACPTLKDFIAAPDFTARAAKASRRPSFALSQIGFLPVIPNPGKIFCAGLNYSEHVKETGRSDSEYPALFLRTPRSLTAHRQPMRKPKGSERFDFEGELAIVIGAPGRHIAAADALRHIAGYACFNDGSVRDWQRHTSQWTAGKNFDDTGSFGPWLATVDAIADRQATWLVTRLNGKEMQRANLAQMIFSIEALIAYISGVTTLETGDVIVTGTPGGVGDRRTPPLYMAQGDRVEIEITGVGVLENAIVDEA